MSKLVFQPLSMSRSGFRQPPLDTRNVARGYGGLRSILFPGRWRLFPQKAAAGLWSTPQDLARLIAALQKAKAGEAGGAISPAIAEETLKPQFDSWQGVGFRLDGDGQARGFYHYGETVGYFAGFGAGVSNGHGWVIMTNAEKERFTPIVEAISKEFGWSTPPRRGDGGRVGAVGGSDCRLAATVSTCRDGPTAAPQDSARLWRRPWPGW